MPLGSGVRHYNTHVQLYEPTSTSAKKWFPRFPDAIIVPASRKAPNLRHAISLARKAKCDLVIICSREANSAEVADLLAERSFTSALVIDLQPGYAHALFEFDTTKFDDVERLVSRKSDLSMKRNLAIVLAHFLGWQKLFFIDDDIRNVKSIDLHRTVSMLGSYPVAGMRVKEYPDNSVACLANRLTGTRQDVFVSGSVLAVNCADHTGFFPDIYNEDWFYFYDDVADGKLGHSRGFATQLEYDPFADPQRAARQEFGDFLAEGLYAFLHDHKRLPQITAKDWAMFRIARESFLENIKQRAVSRQYDLESRLREGIVGSIDSALGCLALITPDICQDWVQRWRTDMNTWKKRIRSLQRTDKKGAIKMLRLEEHCRIPAAPGHARAPRRFGSRSNASADSLTVGDALRPLLLRSQAGLDTVLRTRKPGKIGIPAAQWTPPGQAKGEAGWPCAALPEPEGAPPRATDG